MSSKLNLALPGGNCDRKTRRIETRGVKTSLEDDCCVVLGALPDLIITKSLPLLALRKLRFILHIFIFYSLNGGENKK